MLYEAIFRLKDRLAKGSVGFDVPAQNHQVVFEATSEQEAINAAEATVREFAKHSFEVFKVSVSTFSPGKVTATGTIGGQDSRTFYLR